MINVSSITILKYHNSEKVILNSKQMKVSFSTTVPLGQGRDLCSKYFPGIRIEIREASVARG